MDETLFIDPEEWMDRLLQDLGSQGTLDMELSEEDLDRLMAGAPQVSLTAGFDQRAQVAMANAQSRREKRNPALALGIAVAQARSRVSLGLAETADRAGISVRLLEVLENGCLSIRQILRNFPPIVVAQLLAVIDLAVHEFTDRLMDLAATGGRTPMATTARTVEYQRRRDNLALVAEVADYVAALQRAVQSNDLPTL